MILLTNNNCIADEHYEPWHSKLWKGICHSLSESYADSVDGVHSVKDSSDLFKQVTNCLLNEQINKGIDS